MYECPHLRLKINKIQFLNRKPCLGTNWKGEGARGSKQKQQHVVQEVCKARAEAGRMVHLIRGGSRGIWRLSRLIIRWAQDDWSHAITARYYLNYSLKKLHVWRFPSAKGSCFKIRPHVQDGAVITKKLEQEGVNLLVWGWGNVNLWARYSCQLKILTGCTGQKSNLHNLSNNFLSNVNITLLKGS